MEYFASDSVEPIVETSSETKTTNTGKPKILRQPIFPVLPRIKIAHYLVLVDKVLSVSFPRRRDAFATQECLRSLFDIAKNQEVRSGSRREESENISQRTVPDKSCQSFRSANPERILFQNHLLNQEMGYPVSFIVFYPVVSPSVEPVKTVFGSDP